MLDNFALPNCDLKRKDEKDSSHASVPFGSIHIEYVADILHSGTLDTTATRPVD